jgi:hypothetical protein
MKQHVTILVGAFMPRPFLRDPKRFTKKLYHTYISCGRWPVVYSDHENVIVKQFGRICIYRGTGQMTMGGFDPFHPRAMKLLAGRGRISHRFFIPWPEFKLLLRKRRRPNL